MSILDTCIIIGKEDGKYIYMRPDGSKSSDRETTRFLGVTDKGTLSETLEKAIALRKAEASTYVFQFFIDCSFFAGLVGVLSSCILPVIPAVFAYSIEKGS